MNRAARALGPVLVFGVYAAIVATFLFTVPVWDGRQYFDQLLEAVKGPFDPMAFNLFGHPSMAYFLLVGAPQFLDPGNVPLLHLANALLGALVLVAFHRIVRRVFPDAGAVETWLLVALMGLNPVFLACMANLNADFGVLVFFLPVLVGFLERRMVLTVVAGIGLVLSKESGLVLFGLAAASHVVFHVLSDREPVGEGRTRRLLRQWPLALPVLVLAVYFAIRAANPEQPLLWKNQSAGSLVTALFTFDLDRPFLANLVVMFVLQFQWVVTLWVLAWGARWLWLRRRPAASNPGDHARRMDLAFFAVLFLYALFVLTRYKTYLNARYLLPLFPVWLLIAYASLRALWARRQLIRKALLSLAAGLFLASVFFTVDPVSRAIFGTFPFGRHELLAMTSLTNEYAGLGRDQLVYNLQYLWIGRLEDRFFADVRPTADSSILMHFEAHWYVAGPLDPDTCQRTMRTEGAVTPQYQRVLDIQLGRIRPETLWYLVFPNFADHGPELEFLSSQYDVVEERTYEEDGYALRAIRMKRRP